MPRAFLVKKSSAVVFGHNRDNAARASATSVNHKEEELPWEPLDMSEYEHDLRTAHTVERELGFNGYYSMLSSSTQENEKFKEAESQIFKERTHSRPSMFLIHSLKSKASRMDGLKKETFDDSLLENPFECNHCDISFKRPSDLQHVPSHSSKKPFVCEKRNEKNAIIQKSIEKPLECTCCLMSFSRPEELQRHLMVHDDKISPYKCKDHDSTRDRRINDESNTREKPLQCTCCLMSFSRPEELQRHLMVHDDKMSPYKCKDHDSTRDRRINDESNTRKKPLQCTCCLMSFSRPEELQRHLMVHDDKMSPYKCKDHDPTRDRRINDESNTREKPLQCTCCMMLFTRPGDLERHYSLIHADDKPYQCEPNKTKSTLYPEENNGEKPFKCSHCVMSFTRPSDLQRHSLIHSSNKPYKCEKCDREFTWFGNFQKHILSHMNENSHSSGSFSGMFTLLAREQVKELFIKEGEKYKCRLCSKDFTRLSGLKTHIRMHTGERPYVCEVCSFAFTTSRALKMHTRLHTGEKPYKCEVCDRAFTRRDEMHTHMYIHKGEKPFKCTQCSSSFIRYGHLQRHLLIHSEDKPYKCKLCPKSFTQYRNLQTHTYKHTGERPYRCTFCPKGFTQYGTLQAHERTHTGEKPFRCQLCEKAFITSSHLRWHMKTQHPKKNTE